MPIAIKKNLKRQYRHIFVNGHGEFSVPENAEADFATKALTDYDVLVWALAQLVNGWDKPEGAYKDIVDKVRPVLRRNLSK